MDIATEQGQCRFFIRLSAVSLCKEKAFIVDEYVAKNGPGG
jgi:hypothetical protein